MNMANIGRKSITHRKSLYILNDLRRFNEVFRKDATYDNIKSHKEKGFHPLLKRCIFEKTVKLTSQPF